ncbi:GQ67_00925T0 [Komagataella phaffii]|nr:GQ67_00925T0 [Komagataella phaffii]AOA67074.1 GQ68_00464T0 [Komagataella phaffii GS115]
MKLQNNSSNISLKGATKLKVAAPKPKYIEPILLATSSRYDGRNDDLKSVLSALAGRIQDPSWSVVYKSLIVLHIMIREGEENVTLKYLSRHVSMLEPRKLSRDGHYGARSIVQYSKYLAARAREFSKTQVDFVRDEKSSNSSSSSNSEKKGGILRTLSVDKGLLREVESVQRQIESLLKCEFAESEVNNDIVLTSFRMLVYDLLALYQCLNEGVINILEHYFEMSKVDAERALGIYKDFVDQTVDVVKYLKVAKHLEHSTKLHVPTIKHAPTELAGSLEDYLNDKDFEINRRQYLAEKQTKSNKSHSPVRRTSSTLPASQRGTAQQTSLNVQTTGTNPWGTTPQAFAYQPIQNVQSSSQQQMTAVLPYQLTSVNEESLSFSQSHAPTGNARPPLPPTTSFYQPSIQPVFTGVGFGGYTGGNQVAVQTTGNPFFQSSSAANQIGAQPQNIGTPGQNQTYFQGDHFNQQSNQFGNQHLNNQAVGQSYGNSHSTNKIGANNPLKRANTNPFAFQSTGSQPVALNNSRSNPFSTVSQPAASTGNPFASSSSPHVQLSHQPTAGGLEKVPTVSVFPETRQQQQQSQHQMPNYATYSSYNGPSLI